MNKKIIEKVTSAISSINDTNKTYVQYITSIKKSRRKWDEVVKELDCIIQRPQISIKDFEIDG